MKNTTRTVVTETSIKLGVAFFRTTARNNPNMLINKWENEDE